MVKAFAATLACVLLVLGLEACGSSNSSPSPTSTPKAGAIHPPARTAAKVHMTQSSGTYATYAFTPATVNAKVGTAVMWTNKTGVLHSVTFDSGMSGSTDVEGGKSASFTFSKAGTYRYHCKYHPYMKGTVKVQ